MNQKVFIFIGRSGCGKGTQANLLMDYLKQNNPTRESIYIQTGAELREFIKGESFSQQKCRESYMSGSLQPEFLTLYVWIKFLVSKYTGTEHIIFDGTPRKLHEAGVLDSMIEFFKLDKPNVINIDISKEEAKRRLMSRGRMDDSVEDIDKRLSWYETDVAPTVAYYENNPRYNLLKLDGSQPMDKVFEEIKQGLSL